MLGVFLLTVVSASAQQSGVIQTKDSSSRQSDTSDCHCGTNKSLSFKLLAVPLALYAYGTSVKGRNGFVFSSIDVQDWRQKNFPDFRHRIDNYLPALPLLAVYALDLAHVKSRNDWKSQTILLAISYGINGLITTGIKNNAHEQRPDKSNYLSFPSGHTSTAFVAAEMLHQEFKDKSIWISVAGYTVASAVGVLRILNNKHWLSDVAAGAGIGIFSVKASYLVYPWLAKKLTRKHHPYPLPPKVL